MHFLRALVFLAVGCLPSFGATFGTVVAHAQPIADLAIDEARRRLYIVNTASNQVEVYATNTNPPRLSNTIRTDATPLSIALSRSGRYLYVACYGSSALDIIDLSSSNFSARSVALSASPEAVAVGFNEKVLISTIGTGVGQNVLITYDPTADALHSLESVVITPAAPSVPQLPPPSGVMALASHAHLQASVDGRTIVGVHELATNSRTVFTFDVASSVVLGARNVPVISPVLAVSPDASHFLSGPMLFETSSMLVMAQQNAVNAPYVFPATANFNIQTSQGGAVYAQTPAGQQLITAYNIVPVQNPAARANAAQLLINSPDNLLIQLGVQLPENVTAKMAITSDSSTVYAISQSGFMVIPIGSLQLSPIAVPDSNVALLASDQCGVTASLNSAVIPVRNAGSRTLTATAQVLTTAATSAAVRVTARPYGGDVTAQFNGAVAARGPGTVTPDQLLIQSNEAVNIIPNVRVFQNYRNAEARGSIFPVDIGATTTGLTDMLADPGRQRLYIANPALNRIEIFDMQRRQFVAPLNVGQLPRTLSYGSDSSTLYVANAGGESISIVDLNKGVVTGRVNYPPVPFGASFALITPQLITSTLRGPQVLMSDGTLWKIVGDTLVPRTLNTNIFGTLRNIPAPQSMVSTPEGAYMLLLAGNGNAYLYDANVDDFVSTRTVISPPITGYYGPVAAGPSGQYFLVNDQILNIALTPIGSAAGTGPVGGGGLPTPGGPTVASRPVAAIATVGAQTFARFSTPLRANATAVPTDPGLVELVDVTSQRTTASSNALESPLAAVIGAARTNVVGRTMAVDSSVSNAYVLTASGLSVIPLTATPAQNAPQLTANPVVNTANFSAGIAPGGLISIVGKSLAADATYSATPLPTLLGGVCVTLNNAPLPLLATSAGQINAQLPFTLAAGRYPLVVRSIAGQAASSAVTVTVAKYAPAVFLDDQGPMIFHKNGPRVDKAHPASRDEPLVLYLTGMGVTTGGRVTTGQPSPSNPLAVTLPVQLNFGPITIANTAVIVDWSGLTPNMIGLYEIHARVPGNHWKGDALPVTVRIGGISSVTSGPSAAVVYVD
jgi:uncharacterized protein (TIGR03437 family)